MVPVPLLQLGARLARTSFLSPGYSWPHSRRGPSCTRKWDISAFGSLRASFCRAHISNTSLKSHTDSRRLLEYRSIGLCIRFDVAVHHTTMSSSGHGTNGSASSHADTADEYSSASPSLAQTVVPWLAAQSSCWRGEEFALPFRVACNHTCKTLLSGCVRRFVSYGSAHYGR
jgi:hypothetical protein